MIARVDQEAIEAALEAAGICSRISTVRELSGGCIHRVVLVTLDDRTRLVCKVNALSARAMFDGEAAGLRAIAATRTVIVPQPLAVVTHDSHAAILMTFIEPPSLGGDSNVMWRQFGFDLAAMHVSPLPAELSKGFGFTADNHLGTAPQPNDWHADWAMFNVERRLGHQLTLARSRGMLIGDELLAIENVMRHADRMLPASPHPSLIHGDLWSGNVVPAQRAGRGMSPTCAVIDPATYVGDAVADIAMMKLFGGFPQACFDAWQERTGIDHREADVRRRIAVYQLYHVLNHVNIFGRGYIAQAMGLASEILRA